MPPPPMAMIADPAMMASNASKRPFTVKSYVRQIFNTLDINDRVHAASCVHRNDGRICPEWRRDDRIPSAVL